MSSKPPSGWYPDDEGVSRWWDGENWTEHTQPSPPPPQQQLPPAGWHPDPRGSGALRYWDGTRWTEHVASTPTASAATTTPASSPTQQPKPDAITESTNGPAAATATSEQVPTTDWIKEHWIGVLIAGLVVLVIVIFSLVSAENPTDSTAGSSGETTQDDGGDSSPSGGGGERRLKGSWEVRMDPERTVELSLDGSYNVVEDTSKAAAGESDIWVETFGSITATNVSDGRNIEGFGTGLELFVPIDTCPDWEDINGGKLGTHCSRDLVSFDIPSLDVGASEDVTLKGVQRVTSVKTEQVQLVMDALLNDAVVVSADRVFGSKYLDKLNPTCGKGDVKWITYFTEDPDVTACSTEPDGS